MGKKLAVEMKRGPPDELGRSESGHARCVVAAADSRDGTGAPCDANRCTVSRWLLCRKHRPIAGDRPVDRPGRG